MAKSQQRDLFETEAEPELFEPGAAPPAYRPDLDQVRARLHKILAEARAAEKLPWTGTGFWSTGPSFRA